MLVFYLKAEGPVEQSIMSLLEKLEAVITDTASLTAEGAQIRAAIDEFKANAKDLKEVNESLKATIESLRAQLANGSSVTDEQLQNLIVKAEAKNAAIEALYTPDFVGTDPSPTPPAGPGE